MITRISIIPFDLGGSDVEAFARALDREGFVESPLEEMDKRLVGLEVTKWVSREPSRVPLDSSRVPRNPSNTMTLYLECRGFGVAVDREVIESDIGDHRSVAKLLEQRWDLHHQVREGSHSLANKIEGLRARLEGQFGNSARWSAWEGIPYVFTFYVAEGELPHRLERSRDARLGVVALSEPSRVRLGDTEPRGQPSEEEHSEIVRRIKSLDSSDLPANVETNPEVFCGATWASVVVVGSSGEPGATINIYELLEVRTQIAWLAAHQIRRWCERHLARGEEVRASELDDLRWQVLPLLREARQLSDAAMSTRHSEILAALRQTSGLEQEIEATEQVLQWTYEAAEWAESRRRRRYELAVEVLLGILAVLQLATLIYEVPLVSLPTWAASVILIGAASGIAFVVFRNRGR